jgi:F-type H+-transporting ATPase subunit b
MEAERERFEKAKLSELQKAREEADGIIKNANEAAEKIKSETIAQATEQAEKMIEQTRSTLAMEKEKMISEAKKEIGQLVAAAAEKVVRSKIDPAKDRNLIEQSLKDAGITSNRTVET